jgi:hypothetical protein
MSENEIEKAVMPRVSIGQYVGQLTGERGLITAIVAMAYADVHYGKPDERLDALEYFSSGTFKQHAQALDLPDDMTLRKVLAHGKSI